MFEPVAIQAADRREVIDETGLTHFSDACSRAGGITLCGRSAIIVDDDGFEAEDDRHSRGLCMNCRDGARRLDTELAKGTS